MTEPAERFDRFATDLKAAGVRMTVQRRVLLTVLAETTDHPDATELYRRAVAVDNSVSLSTVYRTLRLLEDRGVIQRHAFGEGRFADRRARFENADAAHHDHLIDVDTGQVIEFQSERIEKLQAEIAAELGYEIVRHRLELYGRKSPSGRKGGKRG